jgi:hypothetical protein
MNGHHSNVQRLVAPSNASSSDERQIDVMTDDTSSNASDDDDSGTSPKKSNFSISAILGLEKNDLKTTTCH